MDVTTSHRSMYTLSRRLPVFNTAANVVLLPDVTVANKWIRQAGNRHLTLLTDGADAGSGGDGK